ncbi:MAG TPA: membrane protein insertion efficiency factor YidD [Nitrospinota bacterium]|nr:membrane protein insertion efficiency factor YidD [Nitrospinota bacterium]
MLLKNLLVFLIKIYQKVLSPLKLPSCRFYPSCSSYAIRAINKHGTVKGFLLTMFRIMKCNPLHPGGVDFP